MGNRLAMGAGGEVSAYTYDPANRLTSVDGVGYTWDDGDRWVAWQLAG